ncbi:MAG TPA: carboxypeptidase-like regulatory domain-containing protein, partial [Kofleriaceae bacterium]|nr:carboxypeptidase-like regulatory domain-containing protein [Kofleriaceae bacterium]
GDYDRAAANARAALAIYDRAPGQLTSEAALRELRYRALIVGARALEATGRGEDAFSLMSEAIRSFPDRSINGAQFDPTAVALFRKVKQELSKQGAGTIDIKVDDPAATVFIDEQFVASGSAHLEKLAPGPYRVYVTKGKETGRVRDVDLAPGTSLTIDVPWTLEAAFRNTSNGLVLETHGADNSKTIELAVRLGHALGASSVVLLSIQPLNGRRAIVGYSIDVESQSKAFAAVQIDPVTPSSATLKKLAALLGGDKSVTFPELITKEPAREDLITARSDVPPGPSHTSALVLGGLGLAALVAAGGFELSSRDTYGESQREADDARQHLLYDSANSKYKVAQAFAIGGAVSIVAAAVLWIHARPEHAGAPVAFVPSVEADSIGFAAMGSF